MKNVMNNLKEFSSKIIWSLASIKKLIANIAIKKKLSDINSKYFIIRK